MRWREGRRSENVEDIRYEGGSRRRPVGMKLGGGTILLVLLASFLLGQNPLQMLAMLGGIDSTSVSQQPQPRPAGDDDVLADLSAGFPDFPLGAGTLFVPNASDYSQAAPCERRP